MTTFNYLEMIGAFMHPTDRECIKDYTALAASRFQDCIVLQIGVENGGSVYCSRAGAPRAKIYGVDLIGTDRLQGTDEQKRELAVEIIKGDSTQVWREFVQPIHFLFIDGDHSHNFVLADLQNWTPKIPVGGVVGLHDALLVDFAPGVSQAIEDWLKSTTTEWNELEHSEYSRFFERTA